MNSKEYTIKERYCPSKGENVIVKVASTSEHEETCISGGRENHCKNCILGIAENTPKDSCE